MKKTAACIAAAAAAVFLGWLMLAQPAEVGAGARSGIGYCGAIIIPSLFPFLVLAGLVIGCRSLSPVLRPVGWIARNIYLLPETAAPALLLSWIGGYPAGARSLAALHRSGDITSDDARYGLTVCVNSGPAFMVGIVGGTLGSYKTGLALFGCQLLAGLITGRLFALALRRRRLGKTVRRTSGGLPFAPALVNAVVSAASGTVNICAFVIFFSALLGGISALGVLSEGSLLLSRLTDGLLSPAGALALLKGLAEICCGSAAARGIPPSQAALVLPFLLSFAGLSVIFQTASFFPGSEVDMAPMALSRLVHGVLTAALATPQLYIRSLTADVYASAAQPVLADGFTVFGTVLLLLLCAMLILSVSLCGNYKKYHSHPNGKVL